MPNNCRVVVRVEESQYQIEPPPVGRQGQYIQKENEQVVCVPRFCGQRFVVNNFEIDQPRSPALLVIKHIVGACIPMRPLAAKLITP
jgi:hypothetical protein